MYYTRSCTQLHQMLCLNKNTFFQSTTFMIWPYEMLITFSYHLYILKNKVESKIKKPKIKTENEAVSNNRFNFLYQELFMVSIKVRLLKHFKRLPYYMLIIIENYMLLFFSCIILPRNYSESNTSLSIILPEK